jgi:large subunit ribosomal protein L5
VSAEAVQETKQNLMRTPHLVKVVVNMGVGEGGERLQKAERVLEAVTGRKPSRTFAKDSVRDWGVRKGGPIGCKVTMRGEEAHAFLKKALWVVNNRVAEWSIDKQGNLSFGIRDHTDFEGQRYDPEVGVFGMDINAVLDRAGMRVRDRRIRPGHIPARHRVSRDEAKEFLRREFNVEVVG